MKNYFYIFFTLFTATIFITSCKKEPKKIAITQIKTNKGMFPVMEPFDYNLPKLSSKYVTEKKNAIEHFYNKNWPNSSLNGSFLVAKEGQIITEKYEGFANYRNKTKINCDTPIHIASVSKVITATAILKLIDAKKINLDQKVNTILTTFPYPEITIKTLLNHRSGMRNYAYFTTEKNIWDKSKILTNQDILDLLVSKKIDLEAKTDTKFNYCNTNYAILALVIEKITGLKYGDAIKKMIFEPLQMDHSYVFDYDLDKSKSVPSYKGNYQEIGLDFLDAIYGDKNIYSTPRDLLKLDLARHAPNFLSPELNTQIYEGYSNEHVGTKNYGLGIRMINWDSGQHFYFHNGWWHGFTSSYISLGKEKLTIISLSNKFTRATYKVKNISSLFGDYPFKVSDSI